LRSGSGGNAMTKSDLIERMCRSCGVPTGRSEQLVNAIFDAIEQALSHSERVEIRGFGSFEVRTYRGYLGRNPRTGTTVDVKPKRLPFFKVGKELKDRVQRGAERTRDPAVVDGGLGGDGAPAAAHTVEGPASAPRPLFRGQTVVGAR
jgi:integration host factor subunit beta